MFQLEQKPGRYLTPTKKLSIAKPQDKQSKPSPAFTLDLAITVETLVTLQVTARRRKKRAVVDRHEGAREISW